MVDILLCKNEYKIFKSVDVTIRRGLRQKGEKKREYKVFLIKPHTQS
jgi:hypothetical protein